MMILKNHEDLLGLGATAVRYEKSKPVLLNLIGLTFVLALLGNFTGHYEVYEREKEKAAQVAAAQAEAAEREKNRERDARIKQIHDLGLRYQFELESDRKRILGTIENVESYREKIPQVKKFLAEYQLPAEVDSVIREPIDMNDATMADTYDLQVKKIAEPTNLKEKYAKWRELLAAAGRYAEGIDRNNDYFNGYLKSARIDEQFKAEFGKRPMQQAPAVQPQADAAPAQPVEQIVEQAVSEPVAPVAEAEPVLAPAPKPRQVAPQKPQTIPAGSGRVQVTDW